MRIVSILSILIFLMAACISGGIFFLIHYPTIDLEQQRLTAHAKPTILLDDKGQEWARFQLDKREPIPLKRIPQHLINAFLAAEDHTFFKHNGIYWRGILRSALINLRHGRMVQGASTITQQLVKLIFLSHEKTISRKIKEQFIALTLEFQYSKEQILEAYLNTIYCGAGIYGIQAAAQRFWNKNAEDLNVAECALLAGIVRSPVTYCPIATKNRPACQSRRNLVLKLMEQHNFISPDEHAAAIKQPIELHDASTTTQAAHAKELIRQTAEVLVGKDKLYAGGLVIKTTLNFDLQKQAEKIFNKQVAPLHKSMGLDGACLTLDAQSSAIKALVGGVSFAESQFNRATQARRQMGSIFKPLVYTAALQRGKTFADLEVDEPLTQVKDWNPNNVNHAFEGTMTLAHALITSNNIIAIKTFLEVGPHEIIALAKKCHLPGPLPPYPSLALGCTDCSLLEATALYTTFVHQGIYQEPYIIEWIKDRWGKKIWKHQAAPEQVLAPSTCSQLLQVLKMVPHHLATRLQTSWLADLDVESLGKTGTTNESRTCWYIGATPSYVTGIYLGCDDNRSLAGRISATRTVAPLWLNLNRTLNHPIKTFSLAPELREIRVDSRSGYQTSAITPGSITLLV